MELTKAGYTYKITITAEDLATPTNLKGGTTAVAGVLNPPQLSDNKAPSLRSGSAMVYPHWAYKKIVEPRYDGVGIHTGQPVNSPTFISENHVLALMRLVDRMLAPSYQAMIKAKSNTTGTG